MGFIPVVAEMNPKVTAAGEFPATQWTMIFSNCMLGLGSMQIFTNSSNEVKGIDFSSKSGVSVRTKTAWPTA